MVTGDVQSLSDLMGDDLVLTGPPGTVMTKEKDLEANRILIVQIQRFDLFETRVHPADTLIATTTEAKLEATFDQHPALGIFAYTHVWRESDPGLRIVAGHCSRVEDL